MIKHKSHRWLKFVLIGIGVLLIGFVVIQLVPVERTNPAVKTEIRLDGEALALAEDACFDCHSNETKWPWYSKIAPVSWLVTNHVNEGRETLNFSEWSITQLNSESVQEITEVIREGEMPPWDYRLVHPEARLTDEEKDILIAAFAAYR